MWPWLFYWRTTTGDRGSSALVIGIRLDKNFAIFHA
jgi:hypothetical protein